MIPKILHYVWLGGREIPENLQAYMATWTMFMPDWEVRGWTEDTITKYLMSSDECLDRTWLDYMPLYVRQAYEAKKYAFVSDYVRLWALEQFGGVYMDTDVEVIRPFDQLPEYDAALSTNHSSLSTTQRVTAFIGFEESLVHLPGTCVMGCEPHCQWVRDMLKTYEGTEFINADGSYDLTTNVQRMGKAMMEKYGLIPNGKEQVLTNIGDRLTDIDVQKEMLHVYTHDYFSPITSTRVMRKTDNTYAIHHFAGTWTGNSNGHWYDHPFFREIINALIQVKRFIKGQK